MSPLLLYDITIGGADTRVGIFGCTLLPSSPTEALLSTGQKIADEEKVTLQLVNAERIASPLHLLFSTHHALRAFHTRTQRAKTIGMEILRFAAAQRQIARALELLGVSSSTIHVGGVLLGQSHEKLQNIYSKLLTQIGAEDTPQVLEIVNSTKAKSIQRAFNINAAELNAVTISKDLIGQYSAIAKLVYERCALLSLEK
ncbi:MAG: KEOPS complex subunit Cgi121 [Promethearchaeota archaeon]